MAIRSQDNPAYIVFERYMLLVGAAGTRLWPIGVVYNSVIGFRAIRSGLDIGRINVTDHVSSFTG